MCVCVCVFVCVCVCACAQPSPAVEMSGLLAVELTLDCPTVLCGTEPLEAIVDQLRILLVEVLMGHHVRGAGVYLVASHLGDKTSVRVDECVAV